MCFEDSGKKRHVQNRLVTYLNSYLASVQLLSCSSRAAYSIVVCNDMVKLLRKSLDLFSLLLSKVVCKSILLCRFLLLRSSFRIFHVSSHTHQDL